MKRETIIKGLKELVKKGWEINEEEGTIKNPETGRSIKIKTALSYDPSHPAYKLAQKQSGGDSGDGEKKYDSSGETDYFEYYEDLPDNIDKLMDKYFMEEPTFDYDELSDIRDEFKQQGWTFDVGLDGDPIDLRPLRDDEKTSTEEPKSSSSETGNDVSFDYDEQDNSLTFGDGEKVKVDYDGDFQYKDEWFNVNDYENEDELKQAIADKVGSKNENKSMKISKSRLREIVKEVIKEESDYQEFFKRALEKTGKSIPQMSDEEKKAFFNKIDKAWKGKSEKNEGNAFGAAVTKAKKQGKDSFEVGGKTYKVKESVVSERRTASKPIKVDDDTMVQIVGDSDNKRFRELTAALNPKTGKPIQKFGFDRGNEIADTKDELIKKLQKKYGKSIKFESLNERDTMGKITEVTDKEINALRQLAKDVDKIKKDYLKIVNMGDKELKSSKLNKDNIFLQILKMKGSLQSLIQKFKNQKILNRESVVNEQSSNRDIIAISTMTGVPWYKIEDFVRKHKLKDLKKVKKLVKGMGVKKDEKFAKMVNGHPSEFQFKRMYKDLMKRSESVNEQSSNRDIIAISTMTGVPWYKIEDFVRKHKLKDLKKVKKLVKGMGVKKDEKFAKMVGGHFGLIRNFKDAYKKK